MKFSTCIINLNNFTLIFRTIRRKWEYNQGLTSGILWYVVKAVNANRSYFLSQLWHQMARLHTCLAMTPLCLV